MKLMVENSSKIKFAERLHLALDSLGWKHRGRPKALQGFYLKVGVNLSEKTFHKWLKGQSFPDWDNLIILAQLTQKSISYLIYGKEEAEILGTYQDDSQGDFYTKKQLYSAFTEALEQAVVFNLVTFKNSSSAEQMFHAFTRELSLEENSNIPFKAKASS